MLILGHVANVTLLPIGSPRRPRAEQFDVAPVRLDDSHEHADRRRLPGTVFSEKPVDFALTNGQRQIIDRSEPTKRPSQVVGAQNRCPLATFVRDGQSTSGVLQCGYHSSSIPDSSRKISKESACDSGTLELLACGMRPQEPPPLFQELDARPPWARAYRRARFPPVRRCRYERHASSPRLESPPHRATSSRPGWPNILLRSAPLVEWRPGARSSWPRECHDQFWGF